MTRNIRETVMAEHIGKALGKETVTDEEVAGVVESLEAASLVEPATEESKNAAECVRFYNLMLQNPGTTTEENWIQFDTTVAKMGSTGDVRAKT